MTYTQAHNIKTQDEARQFAIDWHNWQSEQSLSLGELIQWQIIFETLANKYHLIKEFKENGIV